KTIKENGEDKEVDAFTFRFPNKEVSLEYRDSLFKDVFGLAPEYSSKLTLELPDALAERAPVKVARLLGEILTSIASNEHPPKENIVLSERPDTDYEPTQTERYYHAILHGCFLAAGFEVHSEGSGALGRDDIALYLNDKFRVIIELKYCHANLTIENEGDVTKAGGEGKEAEPRARKMSAALDRAEKQMKDMNYAGPYRAAGCTVTCMAVALRNRNQVAVRFFEY
ncbi:MAG: PD-(D/E)XK nuclease domain-containing protein, partial [Deltaproteobacteria bacterium]|nr:PD-(D/E)XK nuclease domain-containing protein [Deltaproteobacteria bacterium]